MWGTGALSPGFATTLSRQQIIYFIITWNVIMGYMHACRCRAVQPGVRAVAGRAQQAGHPSPRRRGGAPAGRGAARVRRRGRLPLRRADGAEGPAGRGRPAPPPLRPVEGRRRALPPLDRRLPPLRDHQGQFPNTHPRVKKIIFPRGTATHHGRARGQRDKTSIVRLAGCGPRWEFDHTQGFDASLV
jgi:hypothetical protein